jgi:UDP-GlcNAc:undecaprenyl-phosphate GlcNAc-1-phosphate transferase
MRSATSSRSSARAAGVRRLPPEVRLALGLVVASAIVYSATPLAIRVAARMHFYDKPIGYKGHARPTPYLGGSAVMVGFLLALLAVSVEDWSRTLPLLGGMAVLWVVGTIDDRRNLAPSLRAGIEVVLAAMLWRVGLGWDLGLGGAADLALTILWVVAVVNAFNLFDNMDGASSMMALVVSACVVVMGIVVSDNWLAIAAATLCGACLGFLPHNMATPARIFLGDGGSMPIGFGVAALVMIGSAEAVPAWQALVVGLLLVGVPALDTGLVVISRRRRGVSILTGGRDHLTHRTHRRLGTARAVAVALGGVQALMSALALFAISGGASSIVVIVVLYLVAAATAIALFEAAEREPEALVESAMPALAVAGAPAQPWYRVRPAVAVNALVLSSFGLVAGTSAFFSGFYRPGEWVPIGLGLLAVATAGAIAHPPRLSRAPIVALVALSGLAAWALASTAWAPSIEQATVDANRQFVLAAAFAAALVLVRTDNLAAWLVGGLAVGTGAVAVVVLARLFGSDPLTLFQTGRLAEPLGYVNGMGAIFVIGFWLWFAAATQPRAALAGLAVGGGTLMSCLAALTESRGVALAAIASLVAVVAVVPGSRLRRLCALAACGGGILVALPALRAINDAGSTRVTVDSAHRAALAIVLGSLVAGVAWTAVVKAHARFTAERPDRARLFVGAGVAAVACVAIVATGVFAVSAGRIEDRLAAQWTTFRLGEGAAPGAAGEGSRLASGAGTRADYWRVAWHAFLDRPLTGVGAGNYDRPYFKARQTAEDVRQPHSIEFQAVSELGLVGGLLLAAFVGALAAGAWRTRSAAREGAVGQALMVAAVGGVTAWLVHTSVDWLHLLPGVSAVALALAAVLLRNRSAPTLPAPTRTPGRAGLWRTRRAALVGTALAGVALAIAGGSLGRQGLADYFRDRASTALGDGKPLQAIVETNRSLRLDGENPETYYLKAASVARFDEADLARRTLVQALHKEPDNFVTWTLLGDLAVRRGRFGEAKRNYSRASALNPRDAGLRALAADPRQAAATATP